MSTVGFVILLLVTFLVATTVIGVTDSYLKRSVNDANSSLSEKYVGGKLRDMFMRRTGHIIDYSDDSPVSSAYFMSYINRNIDDDFRFFLASGYAIKVLHNEIKVDESKEKSNTDLSNLFYKTIVSVYSQYIGYSSSILSKESIRQTAHRRQCVLGVYCGLLNSGNVSNVSRNRLIDIISETFDLTPGIISGLRKCADITSDIINGVGRIEISRLYRNMEWLRTKRELIERYQLYSQKNITENDFMAFQKALTFGFVCENVEALSFVLNNSTNEKAYIGYITGLLFGHKFKEDLPKDSFKESIAQKGFGNNLEKVTNLFNDLDSYYRYGHE